MKQICFRRLQSLVVVALCVVMAVAFNSCSSDDDEKSANDNLSSVVVGTWAQDGDNDILTIKADGTGVGYDNPTDYENNNVGYQFKWEYKNGWVYVTSDDDFNFRMRVKVFFCVVMLGLTNVNANIYTL